MTKLIQFIDLIWAFGMSDDCNEILRCQFIYEAFREDDLLALAINNDHVMTLDNGWDLQRIRINQSINQSTKEGNDKPAGNAIIEEYIIPIKMIQEYISINVWLEIMIIGAGNAIIQKYKSPDQNDSRIHINQCLA